MKELVIFAIGSWVGYAVHAIFSINKDEDR